MSHAGHDISALQIKTCAYSIRGSGDSATNYASKELEQTTKANPAVIVSSSDEKPRTYWEMCHIQIWKQTAKRSLSLCPWRSPSLVACVSEYVWLLFLLHSGNCWSCDLGKVWTWQSITEWYPDHMHRMHWSCFNWVILPQNNSSYRSRAAELLAMWAWNISQGQLHWIIIISLKAKLNNYAKSLQHFQCYNLERLVKVIIMNLQWTYLFCECGGQN